MMETTTSKVLGALLVGAGAYVAIKNYKKDGFWNGVLAASLVFGVVSIKMYKKPN